MSVRTSVPTSPEAVFAAFTVPDELRRWHAPGPDFTVPVAELEARPGGRLRISMAPADGSGPFTFGGIVLEAKPGERLVYTCRWEPPGAPGESLVTIELRAAGDGTEVVVVHDGLPDEAAARDHIQGWTGTLASLVRHFS
ncbi:MAG TPA: SRPBCC family protein [Myxococcota bacterium]|nr:SRPBCC family protein [Myxococcota bacterium]